LLLAAATFLLLILGGVVWSTGSALACPDWPLCYGQIFPRMEGGVLFEHSHRLLAGTVMILTVVLAVRLWHDPRLRTPTLIAVALVLVQAVLGGLTVILRLPLLVRVAHLAVSQAFFATALYLAYQTRAEGAAQPPGPPTTSTAGRRSLLIAALAVYAQLLLGALVRHTGSGMACETSMPFCKGRPWPDFGPGQLQMLHRYWALVVLGLVIFATVKVMRQLPPGFGRLLAVAAHLLVLLQIGLGVASVLSFLEVAVVTAHLAVGALLWGDLFVLYLVSGSLTESEAPALHVSPYVPGPTSREVGELPVG
jgi:heme A synthase